MAVVAECEHHSRNPLHYHSEEEGNSHTDKDGNDDTQGLVGIEQLVESETSVGIHFQEGKDECTSQELKHERHSGGCRQTKRVEHVEHNHVGDHHSEEDCHHLMK